MKEVLWLVGIVLVVLVFLVPAGIRGLSRRMDRTVINRSAQALAVLTNRLASDDATIVACATGVGEIAAALSKRYGVLVSVVLKGQVPQQHHTDLTTLVSDMAPASARLRNSPSDPARSIGVGIGLGGAILIGIYNLSRIANDAPRGPFADQAGDLRKQYIDLALKLADVAIEFAPPRSVLDPYYRPSLAD